jgi:O-antigen/teichoic acid export membrane protein
VITFVTSTLSTTLARFSAIYTAADNQAGLVALSKWAHRWAWIIGTGLMIIGVLSSPALASFFNAASPVPFMILSVGLPFYIVQAIDRGMLQGQTRFNRLSLSYQAEMWVRLAVGIVLVALGFAVNGATVGITLSLIATWLVARTATPKVASADDRQLSPSERQAIIVYAGPVLVGLISQILINNSDVLIVRRFFTPEQAGQYAALALIGRMVFFATWSVVTVMFPIVAQRHERGENHRPLLWDGMGLVGVVSGGILLATIIAPDLIVSILFGSAYAAIAPLLSLYALATALYALSNVVINYRLSTGKGDGTWFVLVASLAQVIGLWIWHPTLTDVVLIQIVIMATLLVSLLIWDALLERQQRGAAQPIKANVPPATT